MKAPYKTKFCMQLHQQKGNKRHWDLRLLSPGKTTVWSFAFPKRRMPEESERMYIIHTPDHPIKQLYFKGRRVNGDVVTHVDKGDCDLYVTSKTHFIIDFKGENIKGYYAFIKIQGKNKDGFWLCLRMKKKVE